MATRVVIYDSQTFHSIGTKARMMFAEVLS